MKRIVALAAALAATTAVIPANLQAQAGEHQAAADAQAGADLQRAEAMAEALALGEIWLEQYRQYQRIPAISAAIVHGDKTVWAKGFGHTDRAMTQPATADTVYSICSISKLFTAVAFMQEWEKGTVRLDEPVTTYLPWAQLAPDERDSVPITMRGLLTHSAGLPREAVNPYWTGPDFPFPTQAEIRAGIGSQDVLFPAATTWQYSNLGLTLVGETVEAVSDTPYSEYVRANILEPLEMADTRPFIPSRLYGNKMAVGWGSLEVDGTRPAVKLFDAKGINPAAGFSSTVNDLAKFAAWQFRLLKSGEPELLRASTLRDMQRVHYITPDRQTSWGLGFVNFQANGREIVGHGGSCPGYRSSLLIDTHHEMAIALAMNTMENAGGIAMDLAQLIGKRMEATRFAAPEGEAIELADYAGTYTAQPWGRDFVIVPWAGGLAMVTPSEADPADELTIGKPLSNDRFRVISDRGEERDVVTFHRDAEGKVTHYERFGQFTQRKGPLPQ
jgi:CubicO group peptidase (beta-lactamase class C family)